MPDLADLLADWVIIDAFQLYRLVEELAFVKALEFSLLLISSIDLIFLHSLGLILKQSYDLIQMFLLLRVNQINLSYFCAFALLNDGLECLTELLFIQSLKFVIYDYYELMGLFLMQKLHKLLFGDFVYFRLVVACVFDACCDGRCNKKHDRTRSY